MRFAFVIGGFMGGLALCLGMALVGHVVPDHGVGWTMLVLGLVITLVTMAVAGRVDAEVNANRPCDGCDDCGCMS